MKILHESLALKKKDETPPDQLQFSQVTEKLTGVVEAEWLSPHTMQWSHGETHPLIEALAPRGWR